MNLNRWSIRPPSGRLKTVVLWVLMGLMVLFIVWPVGQVLWISLHPEGTWSLRLYEQLLTQEQTLVLRSLGAASLATLATVALGLVVSTYLAFCPAWGRRLIASILLLAMISPPFVSALAYILLFGRRGWVTYHLLGWQWNPYGMHGVILLQVLNYLPLACLLISAAFSRLDRALLHAAQDLGATPIKAFLTVALPLAWPGIAVAVLLIFMKCFSDFGTPIVVGGRFTVLATEAYLNMIGKGQTALACAMCVLMLLPGLWGLSLWPRILREPGGSTSTTQALTQRQKEDFSLGRVANTTLGTVSWLLILLLALQYVVLFLAAILDQQQGHWVPTMQYFEMIDQTRKESFARSLIYALWSASLATLLGVSIAFLIERNGKKYAGILYGILLLPYMVPGPFFGIGYVLAFHHGFFPLTGTALIVVLNHLFRQLPVNVKTARAGLLQIAPDLELAAQDLGAGWWRRLRTIIVPLLAPAWRVGWINAFTSAMTSLGAIIFLITPSTKVATVELFNALRDGDYGLGAALACILVLLTLFFNLAFLLPTLRKSPQ